MRGILISSAAAAIDFVFWRDFSMTPFTSLKKQIKVGKHQLLQWIPLAKSSSLHVQMDNNEHENPKQKPGSPNFIEQY